MEGVGGQVVLCETERDFAMLPPAADLVEQYLSYAYPWGMARRLERFVCLARARGVCGVVVYGQTFCHHNLEVQVVEEALRPLPVLVLEGDGPGPLLPRDQMRLEAFAEVVRGRTFVEPMP
jgi:benzoyl-CoA reductase/2-hydroxyglutaryl-CoA dehydratase subunit BcrC/BadD/HgdB